MKVKVSKHEVRHRLITNELTVIKALEDDLVGDFKKLLAAQIGTAWEKILLKKGNATLKDHISLGDYEIHNGTSVELYYS